MNPVFVLTSQWRLDASADEVWTLLTDIEAWPRWWPHVRHSRQLLRSAASPVGDVAQFDWRSALGYGLRLRVVTTSAQAPHRIEGHAMGDLRGVGTWTLTPTADGHVDVRYRWQVEVARPWMRRLAPLLRPVFEWNHFLVMRAGARGMARALGCRVLQREDWSGPSTLAA